MTDHDDEQRLHAAFARLREDESQGAPTLARLRARADERSTGRAPRLAWLRFALPLTGAAAAGFVWWIAVRAPTHDGSQLAAPNPQHLELAALAESQRVIALGSLRSPTDALLAPPIAALPSGFSNSLIPAPRVAPAAPGEQQSQAAPARRYSA